MRRALGLARRGLGWTSPNPMVGAVIVKEGRVIAEGYHRHYGGDHAEVDAIKNAKEAVAGATMYVTLEPCHHYGKTPPCVDALLREKLGRVVIAMQDPDDRVAGKSIRKLEEHGIAVTTGVLEAESRVLNEAYIKHRTTGFPFVTLKWAQSLDGRIATASGDAKWISSLPSRKMTHWLRATHDAIMVGARTAITDDPELTVRLGQRRKPSPRVLRFVPAFPEKARLLKDQDTAKTLIAVTGAADHPGCPGYGNGRGYRRGSGGCLMASWISATSGICSASGTLPRSSSKAGIRATVLS
jgi:diaminohydroxyphosphoribosylaminopyrimidine deaminase/5-amino-6-(5-phosphoribosylamino)uracil reductase